MYAMLQWKTNYLCMSSLYYNMPSLNLTKLSKFSSRRFVMSWMLFPTVINGQSCACLYICCLVNPFNCDLQDKTVWDSLWELVFGRRRHKAQDVSDGVSSSLGAGPVGKYGGVCEEHTSEHIGQSFLLLTFRYSPTTVHQCSEGSILCSCQFQAQLG